MRNINKLEAKKVCDIFKLSLPEKVNIVYEKDMMKGGLYKFIFFTRENDRIQSFGFLCNRKSSLEKELWWMIKEYKGLTK